MNKMADLSNNAEETEQVDLGFYWSFIFFFLFQSEDVDQLEREAQAIINVSQAEACSDIKVSFDWRKKQIFEQHQCNVFWVMYK